MEKAYRKLRGRIVEKYGTINAFAKADGRSSTIISQKLNMKTGISQEDMEHWAQLLEVSKSEYGDIFFP